MSDEEVMKRRLLFEEGGTDHILTQMTKLLAKLTDSREKSPTEIQEIRNKMFAYINECEMNQKRSALASRANDRDLASYKSFQLEYEEKIEQMKKDIELTKTELEKEKVVKQNKIMYNRLAELIKKEPPVKETQEKVLKLRSEVQDLRLQQKLVDDMYEKTKEQCLVISKTASSLEQTVQHAVKASKGAIPKSSKPVTKSEKNRPELQELCDKMVLKIKQTQKDIEQKKAELEMAKCAKQNKIKTNRNKKETQEKVLRLQSEIRDLCLKKNHVERMLERTRKLRDDNAKNPEPEAMSE